MISNITDKVVEKVVEKVGEKLTENQLIILNQMQKDPYTSAKVLAEKVGISVRKIETNISKLKDLGYIERIGPAKGGHWKIIKNNKL
jgi:ATP-dependent DNA helicase RecG